MYYKSNLKNKVFLMFYFQPKKFFEMFSSIQQFVIDI